MVCPCWEDRDCAAAVERGGRLESRHTFGFALEELIPNDEVGKGGQENY